MQTTLSVADPVEFVAACPVCQGQSFAPLPVPGRWIGVDVFGDLTAQLGLTRCRACRLVFTNPQPSAAGLKTFYSADTYACHEEDASHFAIAKAELILGKLSQCMPPEAPRTLLDYGAGGGGFLRQARAKGWDVRGFEPAKAGLTTCRRAGLEVTDDLAQLPTQAFGLITMNHVFEHLADPGATLNLLRTYLAPGGRLYIEVPNARSLRASMSVPFLSRRFRVDERYRAYPIHLMYYSVWTLGRLLESRGWTVERSFSLGLGIDRFIVPRGVVRMHSDAAPVAADASRVARTTALRRIKHLIRDTFLGMGLGKNLGVGARL